MLHDSLTNRSYGRMAAPGATPGPRQRRSGGFWLVARRAQETEQRRALFNAETDAEET